MALLGALDDNKVTTNQCNLARSYDYLLPAYRHGLQRHGFARSDAELSSFAKADRHCASIELARALLAKGDPVSWLVISFSFDPNPHMSTMSVMPETSVEGKAYANTPRGRKKVVGLVES